jgi:hypothetical protein
MKSLVIFLVDNGEDTDSIDQMVSHAENAIDVIDWTVRIDIPDTEVDYTFVAMPRNSLVMGLPSRDHTHVTFPGE